ncbi:hypothetical protein [uncultured Aquimarina sp.]|uniref:hypothetical protein n=1 Tax=uncultured Aquimarina sp. TaxID=575652 RepID=UPI002633B922|nr:hypothetical protein [uncultured Aquimarina sp.]
MKILIVLFSIFCFSCKSQSISKEIDLQKQIPQDLIIDKVEKLNFDNDKELETIITASDDTYSQLYEFWFKKGELLRKIEYPWVSINYKWIIDIDHDDLHEIIRAQGYEDGINYGIYDIVDNNHKSLLFFTPIITDENFPNDLFWGYPWDIDSIIINEDKELLVSLDHSIEREDDYDLTVSQKTLPVIFFKGKSTQPNFKFEKHKANSVFLDLKKLISKTN